MNKHDAIQRITNELRALGFTFVESRHRLVCQQYAMQDQAATRQHAIHPCMQDDTLAKIGEIGMRVENMP